MYEPVQMFKSNMITTMYAHMRKAVFDIFWGYVVSLVLSVILVIFVNKISKQND